MVEVSRILKTQMIQIPSAEIFEELHLEDYVADNKGQNHRNVVGQPSTCLNPTSGPTLLESGTIMED